MEVLTSWQSLLPPFSQFYPEVEICLPNGTTFQKTVTSVITMRILQI
jgi:hypothetical protein